jgi:hypothetical protein
MFSKSDAMFAAYAVDPVKRKIMISSRQTVRRLLFWCAIVTTICAWCQILSNHGGTIAFQLTAAVLWVLLLKFDSDVHMLIVADAIAKRNAG